MNYEDVFEFKPWNGKYMISRFLRKHDEAFKAVKVPSKYRGLPVVRADIDVFHSAPYIEEVYLPDSMTVSREMFYGCRRLKKARAGGDVICNGAFNNCISLEDIELSDTVRLIEKYAFSGCRSLKKVVFPRCLEEIGDYAFAACCLEELVFPEKRIRIGELAFGVFSKLPAEQRLYSLVGENDIDRPISDGLIRDNVLYEKDVFALAVEHNCLLEHHKFTVMQTLISCKIRELFPIAEKLLTSELTDELIRFCTDEKMTEETAWLLDCKNRRFGFNGGDRFDL